MNYFQMNGERGYLRNSQAHCLVTQADTRPKPAKELALPTHGQTGIKHETLTRSIKHLGLSGYSNFLPRIKFDVNGQESSPQSPTISYRHPLPNI